MCVLASDLQMHCRDCQAGEGKHTFGRSLPSLRKRSSDEGDSGTVHFSRLSPVFDFFGTYSNYNASCFFAL